MFGLGSFMLFTHVMLLPLRVFVEVRLAPRFCHVVPVLGSWTLRTKTTAPGTRELKGASGCKCFHLRGEALAGKEQNFRCVWDCWA